MKVLSAALAAMKSGEAAALCTVVGVEGSAPRARSARMLVRADGEIVGTIGGGELEYRAIDLALEAIRLGRPQRLSVHLTRDLGMCCGGAMEVYVEPLVGVERVHVFGAGHVGTATALLLQSLEFDVHVYDERPDWLNAERLPACTLVEGDPRRKLPVLGPDDSVLIITHSHALDQDLLEALLPQPVRYLGMIGSRAKVAKFFVRLRAAGVDQSLFRKVCAPVGLDIGAETPEEIAVAIAAEMIRVRRSHSDVPLPLSAKPLPARGGDGVATAPGLED
jgi:xanthine dehydrogenase accessory factor